MNSLEGDNMQDTGPRKMPITAGTATQRSDREPEMMVAAVGTAQGIAVHRQPAPTVYTVTSRHTWAT